MGEGLRIHLFGEPHFEYRGSPHAFSAPPKTLPCLLIFCCIAAHPLRAKR